MLMRRMYWPSENPPSILYGSWKPASRNPDDKGDELSRFLNSGLFLKE